MRSTIASRASSIWTKTLTMHARRMNQSIEKPMRRAHLGRDDQLARSDDSCADDEPGPEMRRDAPPVSRRIQHAAGKPRAT